MKTSKRLLLRAKGIYDVERQRYAADGLLLEGKTIAAVGGFHQLREQFPEVEVADHRPCYLLPGLINTHVHLEFEPVPDTLGAYQADDAHVSFLRAAVYAGEMLRSGVTTLRDAGSSWRLLQLDTPAARKLADLPRMQLAGPPITVTGGHLYFQGGEADSLEEVVKGVRERHKRGCTAIKIIASGGQMTPGTLPERESYDVRLISAMAGEAWHLGLPTFAHCLTTRSMVNAMKGEVQCIEHGACFIRNPDNGLLERVYVPEAMEEFRADGRFFMNAISNNYHALDHCRDGGVPPTARESFLLEQEERECDIFRRYVELGFTPVVGTDAGCGLTYFDETWLECEILAKRCGLTNGETIAAATLNGARCLGLAEITGNLRPGLSADLIALREDPLEDIRALRSVEHVWLEGRQVR